MNNRAVELSGDRCIVLARAIHRAHDALVAHAEAFARLNRLEAAHLSMLHALGLRGEMRMGDLAASVVVGAATVTRRAKQLEERGLVRRKRSEKSQREVLISLTRKGEALFERSFTHLHAEHRRYFDERFTNQEQRDLGRLLDRT
jgi:DNA-binding MarR family transcriptional regulator